jgi:5-methylthioadenosine/S-adenosylhomocysteine deaminase
MLLGAIYAPDPLFAQADAKQAVSVDLLVTGATIVTMDSQRHVIDNGVIAVRGDTIVAVGTDVNSLAPKGIIAKQTIDAKGKLIMPGLINAHTHIPMVLMRGLVDDVTLDDWLCAGVRDWHWRR